MSETYSIEKKRKLADRIHSLSSKEQFKKIRSIIVSKNPEIEFTKNGNGLFAQFQSLNVETYTELEKFLNKADKKKLKDLEHELDDDTDALTSEIQTLTDESAHRKQDYSKKLRLTNTETHLLNRARYENELKKNANSDETDATYYNPDDVTSSSENKKKFETDTKNDKLINKQDDEIFFKKQRKIK